mmetsp:Transcript_5477/g.8509  ORF Transcript_5477/g.8509 Transcript_5477/m.8509 type:complete len:232 (+) Transcript_5477:191-886(+)
MYHHEVFQYLHHTQPERYFAEPRIDDFKTQVLQPPNHTTLDARSSQIWKDSVKRQFRDREQWERRYEVMQQHALRDLERSQNIHVAPFRGAWNRSPTRAGSSCRHQSPSSVSPLRGCRSTSQLIIATNEVSSRVPSTSPLRGSRSTSHLLSSSTNDSSTRVNGVIQSSVDKSARGSRQNQSHHDYSNSKSANDVALSKTTGSTEKLPSLSKGGGGGKSRTSWPTSLYEHFH